MFVVASVALAKCVWRDLFVLSIAKGNPLCCGNPQQEGCEQPLKKVLIHDVPTAYYAASPRSYNMHNLIRTQVP